MPVPPKIDSRVQREKESVSNAFQDTHLDL